MGYRERILQDAPSSYWPLCETSGAAVDIAGGVTTTTGGTAPTLGGAGMVPGGGADDRSWSFGGAGWLETPDNTLHSPHIGANGLMSLECIVTPTVALTAAEFIFAKGEGGGNYEYDLGINADGGLFWRVLDATGSAAIMSIGTAAGTLAVGRRTHLVLTYNRATPLITLYADGVLTQSSSAATGTSSNTVSRFTIGERADGGGTKFQGRISHVAIYPVQLTAAQVAGHYREALRQGVSY